MVIRIPPPPRFAQQDPEFNRWLIELTSLISQDGGINADEITGLQQSVAELENQIMDLQQADRILRIGINTLALRLQNGTSKPPDTYGNDGDWFGVTAGPQRGVHVKVAGAWVLIAS